jgi:hypothetical protein
VTDAGKSDRDAERSAADTEGSEGGTERFEMGRFMGHIEKSEGGRRR